MRTDSLLSAFNHIQGIVVNMQNSPEKNWKKNLSPYIPMRHQLLHVTY